LGASDRYKRIHKNSSGESSGSDIRLPSQKDRDRILYSSAFRRLAGVTQVVGAAEGHIFHNRLTHTLQVAQLAQRLAERLEAQQEDFLKKHALEIDPDVAEAAALAHDLGHPPFGHIAEKRLDELATDQALSDADPDGYEGNAQSFRIITRLAAQREGYRGLDLCRATLNAVLKYPAYRGDWKKADKFGAYHAESTAFEFARVGFSAQRRSLEAQIMDHADAVAYSVHDFDDFYRAGLIPLDDFHSSFDEAVDRLRRSGKVETSVLDEHKGALQAWASLFPHGRYVGDYVQRTALRALGSRLLQDFIGDAAFIIKDERPSLKIGDPQFVQMRFLQSLVWHYVISGPRLATQQHGQKQIISTLFRAYYDSLNSENAAGALIPPAFQLDVSSLFNGKPYAPTRPRLAADIVASFSDAQAGAVYRRLTGVSTGSVTDLVAQ
jgi:dGTPase